MKRVVRTSLLLVAAAIAGVAGSEGLHRLPTFRGWLGRMAGAGELVAIVDGRGVYSSADQAADVAALISLENLRRVAAAERVSDDAIERELDLLRFEFPNEKAFDDAVRESGLTRDSIRGLITEHLQQRQWIEKRLAPELTVSAEEARQFYDAHAAQFAQPQRFRARHIFLAAHAATPPDVVETNRKTITAAAARLTKGEDFAALAAELSEDKATKTSGGDLEFSPFSSARVPSEFIAALAGKRVGYTTAPFRSRLGFHIAQLTDLRSAEQLSFAQAREEITAELMDQKRAAAMAALTEQLQPAEFSRSRE